MIPKLEGGRLVGFNWYGGGSETDSSLQIRLLSMILCYEVSWYDMIWYGSELEEVWCEVS